MFQNIVKRFIGSSNDRYLKSLDSRIQAINDLRTPMQALSDDDLRAKTQEFKQKLENGASLDDLCHEAFAVVRESAVRTLHMEHFDVQIQGGLVLHNGMISEMKTGEGKTLVATLPVYLNALSGQGVHVVTVNDYLARRDAQWMGQIYNFLGMSIGTIIPELDPTQRKESYACDITYGTNNEFGFDYLRDNLRFTLDSMVQRGHNFAIVDEVDSILVDEARTPLIISGPSNQTSDKYNEINNLIPKLQTIHYDMDEKQRSINLTETGQEYMEELLDQAGLLQGGSLYDLQNISLVHHIDQALRAHKMFTRDKDYIVKDDSVIIIDEFTGRMMEGRRYSDGLHQALEAKENVSINNENQTLASITFQNYFRMYNKLAGMTGTAITEAAEFEDIYSLRVVEVPTHKVMVRKDHDDEVYRTSNERDNAVIAEIVAANEKQQPILVGTVSIEKSEELSGKLKTKGIKHSVLNARQHESEAKIISKAGQSSAVTIATNMAGRGTDIQMGGNLDMMILDAQEDDEKTLDKIRQEHAADKQRVLDAGGLYVIGTERHESRRIDNQLRGRSGRQGDPGASKFYLSLEDDLMRIFGSERLDGMLVKLGLEEGEAIIHNWINRAIEKAQQKVEERNYEIRKQLLKFDDVMNEQRKAIFSQRKEIMLSDDISETTDEMRQDVIDDAIGECIPPNKLPEQWNTQGLAHQCVRVFGLDLPIHEWATEEGIADEEIQNRIATAIDEAAKERHGRYPVEWVRMAQKQILLQVLDGLWKDHLLQLDHLRQGIGLRAYAQRDPLNEYKQEAFALFEVMLQTIRTNVTQLLMHMQLQSPVSDAPHDDDDGASLQTSSPQTRVPSKTAAKIPRKVKVPRNAPCPCGSGKKFKHCHGKL